MEKILQFLKGVAKNNNREWFKKNKPHYLEAKQRLKSFWRHCIKSY